MQRERCPAGQVWSESEGRCVKQLPRSSHSGNPDKRGMRVRVRTLKDEVGKWGEHLPKGSVIDATLTSEYPYVLLFGMFEIKPKDTILIKEGSEPVYEGFFGGVEQLPRSSHSGNPRPKEEIFKRVANYLREAINNYLEKDLSLAQAYLDRVGGVFDIALTKEEIREFRAKYPMSDKLVRVASVKSWEGADFEQAKRELEKLRGSSHSGNIEGW